MEGGDKSLLEREDDARTLVPGLLGAMTQRPPQAARSTAGVHSRAPTTTVPRLEYFMKLF